jgi:predicted nucleotidyltransferase
MGRGVYRSAGFLSSAVLKQTVEVISETSSMHIMESLVELLNRSEHRGELSYFLIGGRSLEAHGIVRFTKDVDFLIAYTHIDAMASTLKKAGYHQEVENQIFSRWKHASMLVDDVDVMYVRPEVFAKLSQDTVLFSIGDQTVRVPSIPSLIALKLHAIRSNPDRETKDGRDIAELLERAKGKLQKHDLEVLFAKYGCEHLLQRYLPLVP